MAKKPILRSLISAREEGSEEFEAIKVPLSLFNVQDGSHTLPDMRLLAHLLYNYKLVANPSLNILRDIIFFRGIDFIQ
jgi:hypothetical protein